MAVSTALEHDGETVEGWRASQTKKSLPPSPCPRPHTAVPPNYGTNNMPLDGKGSVVNLLAHSRPHAPPRHPRHWPLYVDVVVVAVLLMIIHR